MAHQIATQHVYATDSLGVRRLIAAPGDPIPHVPTQYGIVTPADTQASASPPLEGYESMTEADVLAVLPTLTAEQLAAVREYEQAHKARGAIWRYKQQSTVVRGSRDAPPSRNISAVSTSGGYAALSPEDLKAEASSRGIDTKGKSTKALIRALQADDAEEQ